MIEMIKNTKCLIFHKWKLIENTQVHKYYQCKKCGKRKTIVFFNSGYEPIKEGFPNPYYEKKND